MKNPIIIFMYFSLYYRRTTTPLLLLGLLAVQATPGVRSTYHRSTHHGHHGPHPPVALQLPISHPPAGSSTSPVSISRSSAQCRSSGGFCEPMFSCLINKGYVAGSCGGFLNVCCSSVPPPHHTASQGAPPTGPAASGVGGAEPLPPPVVAPSNSAELSAQPKLAKSPRNGWLHLRPDNNAVLDSSPQVSKSRTTIPLQQ